MVQLPWLLPLLLRLRPQLLLPLPPRAAAPAAAPAPAAGAEVIAAPMPGTILSINVKRWRQAVKKGDVLAILEAMKMENEIMAPHDATVAAVHVNKGESVDTGAAIVSLQ